MAKQTFTTGQVLTAAQVNALQTNDFNQTVSVKTASYVLVGADKGTRIEFSTSGSVTCTVNTGLFDAGDTVYIQNTGAGVVTITAGTATVNTSASLTVNQYEGGVLYFVSASSAIWFEYASTATGDITGITTGATSGLTGGVTSGTADLKFNTTAKGGLLVGTGAGAVTELSVGANNTVLTADSATASGLKWATPAAGSFTKITTTAFSGATGVSVNNCFTSTYTNYLIVVDNLNSGANASDVYLQFQYSTSTVQATNYYSGAYYMQSNGTSGNYNRSNSTSITMGQFTNLPMGCIAFNVTGVGASSQRALFNGIANGANSSGVSIFGGHVDAGQIYTGIRISAAQNISGNVTVYGLEK